MLSLKAKKLGAVLGTWRVRSHTLKQSYARHLLTPGIPMNYLSRWLAHSSIQTTLIYMELAPGLTAVLGPDGGAIGVGNLDLGLSLTLTSNVRTGGTPPESWSLVSPTILLPASGQACGRRSAAAWSSPVQTP